MKRYLVSGSIQGRGMDADKFYAISEVVEGENIDQARATAEQDGIWVEQVVFLEEVTSISTNNDRRNK